jgi:hypothetical protein
MVSVPEVMMMVPGESEIDLRNGRPPTHFQERPHQKHLARPRAPGHSLDRVCCRDKVAGVKEHMPEIGVVDKGFNRLGECEKVAGIRAEGTREFLNECSGNDYEDSQPDRGRGTTTLESTKNPAIKIRKEIDDHTMDIADVVLHGEKNSKKKDSLITGETQATTCHLG